MISKLIKYIILKSKFGNRFYSYPDCSLSLSCRFEGANKIYHNTSFKGFMGYGSYIGPNCDITANIGRFTSIAPWVRTNRGRHPYLSPFVTSSPMFYSIRKQNGFSFADKNYFEELTLPVEIGNDCWIGENSFLVGGISIGDGAVILAGSVVTKDVPPYAIVGGVPARIIKYRYDVETIRFLLGIKWWNKDISWLKKNWKLLCDINQLKESNKRV